MSLRVILKTIREAGDRQIEEIEMRAQSEIEDILAMARVEADTLREESRRAASASAAAERARIIQQTRVETLQIIGEARRSVVDELLELTNVELKLLRTKAYYATTLHRLVEEALSTLQKSLSETESLQLEADHRDQEVMESILAEMGLDLSITYTLNTCGGIIARSEDGRVSVDNTLESRLGLAASDLYFIFIKTLEQE